MKKKKAFTLLELIISIAIVSILVFIISSIIGLNFKVSTKIYKEDKSYKEVINAMAYVENVVRGAEKLEKIDDPVCNFRAKYSNSTYHFYLDQKEQKLKVEIDGSKGQGHNLIGSIDDMILTYDGKKEVYLWMRGIDGDELETKINIGARL